MIKNNDTKMTANEAAKMLVLVHGTGAEDMWHDSHMIDYGALTEREERQVSDRVKHQVDRLLDFLNIPEKLWDMPVGLVCEE